MSKRAQRRRRGKRIEAQKRLEKEQRKVWAKLSAPTPKPIDAIRVPPTSATTKAYVDALIYNTELKCRAMGVVDWKTSA